MSVAWSPDVPGWPFDKADCGDEADHVWERLSDGSRLCVWCDAKVQEVGRG